MDTKSRHFVVDFWGCRLGLNASTSTLRYLLAEVAGAVDAKLLHSFVSVLSLNLIVGVGLTEEGHLAFRMLPDQNYVSFSFSGCGRIKLEEVVSLLFHELKAESYNLAAIDQGVTSNPNGINIVGFRHGDLKDKVPVPFPPMSSATGEV